MEDRKIDMTMKNLNKKELIKNIETVAMVLCYFAGIGGILYGALSGDRFGYYFIFMGGCALVLVIIHAARRNLQELSKVSKCIKTKQND